MGMLTIASGSLACRLLVAAAAVPAWSVEPVVLPAWTWCPPDRPGQALLPVRGPWLQSQ
jgi:hypothetical protein